MQNLLLPRFPHTGRSYDSEIQRKFKDEKVGLRRRDYDRIKYERYLPRHIPPAFFESRNLDLLTLSFQKCPSSRTTVW